MPAGAAHVSPYSGSWYPDDPSELKQLLESLWKASEQRTGSYMLPDSRAFLVPHAGLVYSGAVAASAYRHIEEQKPERIVILGFSHRGCPPGILVPDVVRFQTPLGDMEVDRDCAEELLRHTHFRRMAEMRLCDHSVEIQLPLLQRAAPAAHIVPLYVGHLDSASRIEAAQRLSSLMGAGSVFLASSDLTHYGSAFHYEPFPVDVQTGERLRNLDYEAIDAASSLSEELFFETLRQTSATVCGYQPVGLLLAALRLHENGEEIFQEVLDYQTSGEITGDFHHSVSYGALGYFPHTSFEVGEREQALLLDAARQTLRAYQETGRRPTQVSAESESKALERRAAAFVTLRKEGQLRGCLGRTSATASLKDVIPELTLAAALEDRRFDPVEPSEAGIEIEISILSPMKRIVRAGDLRVNVHGGFLKAKGLQGLLLPQVATGRNWNAEQFLEALNYKTGVGPDVHSDRATRLYVFRAQIIR